MLKKEKILIVDDEEKILTVVKLYLEKQGFEVISSINGREAVKLFFDELPNLVILDLMLPDLSGEEVCKVIRSKSDVPIIMLTAKITEESMLKGFEIGADDYIIKPFSPRQLIARVTAVLRRSSDKLNNNLAFNNDDLVIDNSSYEVYKNKLKVDLTPIEFKILLLLASAPNRVFTREEIIYEVYREDFDGYNRAIDSHIKNLRKKIVDNPPKYILTVHGIGYKFGGGNFA